MVDFLLKCPNIDANKKSYKSVVNQFEEGKYTVFEYEITALKISIEKENLEIIKLLLSYPEIDVNEYFVEKKFKLYGMFCGKTATNYIEKTALHLAAEIGNLSVFKLLLSHESIDVNLNANYHFKKMKDVYIETEEEKAALFLAFENEHNEIVHFLLENEKTNLTIKSLFNYKVYKLTNVDDEQIEKPVEEEEFNEEEFFEEEFFEEEEVFEKYEEITINSNCKPTKSFEIIERKTLLFAATEKQDIKLIKFILKLKNYDINSHSLVGVERKTALHLAIEKQLEIIAQLLLSSEEIDPNIFSFYKNEEEKTPLYLSVERKDLEMIKVLLSNKKVDINATSNIGKIKKTALYLSIEKENIEIIQFLLSQKEIDINKQSFNHNERKTNLNLAIEKENIEMVKLLISQKNLNVNETSLFVGGEKSPLYCAVEKGNSNIVNLLLSREEIDVNFKYIFLCYKREFDAENSTSIESIVRKESSPLIAALKNGNKEIVKALLTNKKIDINVKYLSFKSCCHQGASNQFHFKEERKEKTSLQIAVEKRFFDIIDLFLPRKEININEKQIIQSNEYTKSAKDNIFTLNKQETLNEKTALHIAIEKNDNEIVEMLLKHPEIDLNIKSINNGKLSKKIRSELINSNLIQSKYQIKDQYYIRKFSQNCIKFNIYNKDYSNSSNEEELTNENNLLETIKNQIKQEQVNNFEDHFLFDERELNQARTSLFIANKNKNQFIIQLLLTNKNIDVNQSSNIETNIITKTHNQNSQKQKFLKQQKLAKNEEKTVLHAAIDDDNIEIVQYLLSQPKIDVNKNSLITIKEEIERFPISIEFSDSKQKENCIEKRNCISPLCLAVINDNIEIIKLLLLNEKLNFNIKSSIQFKKEKILFDSLEKAKEFDFNMELQQKKDDAEIIHNLSF